MEREKDEQDASLAETIQEYFENIRCLQPERTGFSELVEKKKKKIGKIEKVARYLLFIRVTEKQSM